MGDNSTASLALLFLLLLSGIFHLETIKLGFSLSGCKEVERKALLQFKGSLADPSGILSSWIGEDCCRWRGVSCNNGTGNVVKLKLNNPYRNSIDAYDADAANELGGEINPSLLQLKDLEYLDLSMNNFSGVQVPEFIGSLKTLRYLNLSGSYFGGTMPQSLGNLTNLLYLDLNNFLEESNEIDLGWLSGLSSLKYLNLGGADLSKTTEYWLEIVNMLHSLVELHLPNCDLPDPSLNFSSLNFTFLSVLDLSNNGFNSTIPLWLSNISSLVYLDLNSNNFLGEIPNALASLSSLQYLDLSGNSFLGGRLSGNLGKLCNLQTLKLARNAFNGEVSDFINGLSECSNSSLEELDLGFNELSGNLPVSIGYLNNLRYIELWYNSFQGLIPESIGNLTLLNEFYISNNQMNGIFPESIGQLSALEVLELSENKWEGVITEAQFMNLSSLKDLSLTKDSLNISLVFNISSDWIPPFKLTYLNIKSCQLGPKFPTWLRNQNELTTLVLNSVKISDTIPDWFWKLNLTLDELDIAYNQLRGRVPNSLSFRYPAVVDLSSNRFEGPLPLWSYNVTRAYLRDNLFSGSIPHDIGTKMPFLTDLDFSLNFLNGSIPKSFANIEQLLTFALSDNNLSGEIPQVLTNMSSLYILDLSNNSLSGPIPKSIGSLNSLRFLVLGENNLSGELPPSLQNCTLIDSLDFSGNKLSGNIPAWLGDSMNALSILSLSSNSFGGFIPSEICKLSTLHILDLSLNNLSGFIPPCIGNLSGMKVAPPETVQYQGNLQVVTKGRALEYSNTLYLVNLMDLSNNNLSGEMPVELTSLIHLGTLNLSQNHLTGKIPTEIGKLEWLETLDLSRNKLFGPIPPGMTSLVFLNHLNVSYNNLSGEIPTTNQFQTLTDPSIYEGNLALCGFPLPKECPEIDGTSQFAGGDEDDDDDGHKKLWFITGIGLGFIVGFWGVCGTLIIKKSWRHAYFQFVDETKDRLLTIVSLNWARLRRKLSEKKGAGQTSE